MEPSGLPGDEPSILLMEKLVQSLITALENHKSNAILSRSSSASGSRHSLVESRGRSDRIPSPPIEPPTRRSTLAETDVEPFKNRIGREPPYPDAQSRWVTQNVWESYTQSRLQGQPIVDASPSDRLAVIFQYFRSKKWISIQSPVLIAAFHKVNTQLKLSKFQDGAPVTGIEPFRALYYHLDDMRSEIQSSGDDSAKLDFQALEFVAKEFEDRWQDAREETFDGGFCSWGTLWRLFNPGDLVIRKDDLGNEWLLVLIHVKEYRDARGPPPDPPYDYMEFTTWGLSLNSVTSLLYRRIFIFRLNSFTERRKIISLPVYPLKAKGAETETFLKKAAERGRKWQELITHVPSCRMHNGVANPERSRRNSDDAKHEDLSEIRKLKERMIIDERSKREDVQSILGSSVNVRGGGPPPPPPPGPPGWPGPAPGQGPAPYTIVPDTQVSALEQDERPGYQWDNLAPDIELTDQQAQLCPAVIGCVTIASEYVYNASVENLEPVQWNTEAIELLVIDEDKKDLLKGLVAQHSHRARTSEIGDLIENKGKGLVILLYGPPGVGKTLTAESIGEWVGKPLIALSIGDLIVDESQLERRLVDEFERALNWDAILLLDEADVVLEARSFEDVRRNGIVSVFLRQLEYYQGVLFLTTNRISTMDVAFQSRIQVAIKFEDLKPKGRSKIWKGLLESRRKTIDADSLDHIVKKIDTLASANLNGRQIRNVLNIAEGYAFNEFGKPGQMNFSHVQNAVKAALEFQKFFDKAREKNRTDNSVWAPYGGVSDSD